jgi:hypothetical protein
MREVRLREWRRKVLVAVVLVLSVTVTGATVVGALPPPDAEPELPPDDGGGGGGGGGGEDGGDVTELPAEAQAEVQAVAEPLAAAAEEDAAQQFFVAVLLKIADLQARYGDSAPSGELVPFSVLDAIAGEVTDFLHPYALQICKNELVIDGISQEVQAALGFRWWYSLVPPYLIGWIFFRHSKCANELVDRALHMILVPCAIARGHFADMWVAVHASSGFFRSYEAARAADLTYLLGQGIPYGFAAQIADASRRLECVHD